MTHLKSFLFIACLGFSVATFASPSLQEKHGASWPISQGGFVTKNQCMQCHGNYMDLAKKTSEFNVNPHHSHLGEVDCVQCHKPTGQQPDLMCNTCHKFDLKKVKNS